MCSIILFHDDTAYSKEFEQVYAIFQATTADRNKMTTELEIHYKILKYRGMTSQGCASENMVVRTKSFAQLSTCCNFCCNKVSPKQGSFPDSKVAV